MRNREYERNPRRNSSDLQFPKLSLYITNVWAIPLAPFLPRSPNVWSIIADTRSLGAHNINRLSAFSERTARRSRGGLRRWLGGEDELDRDIFAKMMGKLSQPLPMDPNGVGNGRGERGRGEGGEGGAWGKR